MAKKESFLSKLRGESSNLNEEQELRKELLNLKISLSSGQLKETHKIKEIRKSIAQLKTIQKEASKELNDNG
jgi:large subunit ribosomal protein L29